MSSDTPTRRQSDRLLLETERQINDRITTLAASLNERVLENQRRISNLQDELKLMERDGSRGLSVLVERVTGFERRAEDLIKTADREHLEIRATMAELRADVNKLEDGVTSANLDKLPARVDKLEDAAARRLGVQLGARTMLTVYLGGVLAAIGLIYEVAIKIGGS